MNKKSLKKFWAKITEYKFLEEKSSLRVILETLMQGYGLIFFFLGIIIHLFDALVSIETGAAVHGMGWAFIKSLEVTIPYLLLILGSVVLIDYIAKLLTPYIIELRRLYE